MINLAELTDNGKYRNLAGKERGINARVHFDIAKLDDTDTNVEVEIPDFIDGISSSFFLGLFTPSLDKLGSRERFLLKYHFQAPQEVLAQVDAAIRRWEAIRSS